MLDKIRRIKLAAPHRDGGMSLGRCIEQRRSVRNFRDEPIEQGELGQLLWAAQGSTGAEAQRTIASAGALHPLELYVVCGNVASVAPGAYRYRHAAEELLLVSAGDRREKLVHAAAGQDWIALAPAVICIAAVFARTTVKYGARGRGYVYMEAGLAAENLMLQAVALGLATTMVGAFSDDAVARLLHLPAEETPLCLVPVGHPLISFGVRSADGQD